MPAATRPTRAELAILRVLWVRGPSTVRQVHEALRPSRAMAYTTTLKQMQVMFEKGLLVRSEMGRQHLYRSRQSEQAMQKRLVRDLLDRAFGGASGRLIIQALAAQPASREDLREIRRLIEQQERKETRDG
jgi:predicted transcriptional regulator